MIDGDIFAIGLPDWLILSTLGKESHPHQKVTGIRPETVRRTHAHGGTGPKEAVEIEVVTAAIVQNEWHAVAESCCLHRRDRLRRKLVRDTINDCWAAQRREIREVKLRHSLSKTERLRRKALHGRAFVEQSQGVCP